MKKNAVSVIILILVILISLGVVIWSLFYFSIIRLPKAYEPQYIELDRSELGSARYLDGMTAIVTIFADDEEYSWDFGGRDSEKRDEILGYLPIAAEWLREQGAKYGRTLDFVYAESSEDELLCYTADLTSTAVATGMLKKTLYREAPEEWDFIENSVRNDEIREKYNCDNTVYLFAVNVPSDESQTSAAFIVYDKPHRRPYEFCALTYSEGTDNVTPSVIAHEIIHTFGAPDLYKSDSLDIGFGITVETVKYCKENYPTDIMVSTKNPETGVRLKDRINNEITDITAYYLGWLDTPPINVDEYKIVHSQFDKKTK